MSLSSRIALCLLFAITSFHLSAQSTPQIDTLKQQLEKGELKGKEKIKAYFELTRLLQVVNPKEGLLYSDSAIAYAHEEGWKLEEANALSNKAGLIIFQGKLQEADSLLNLALSKQDTGKKWTALLGNIYTNKGNIGFFSGAFDSAIVNYDRSAAYSYQAGDSSIVNKSLNNKAGVLYTQGKYQLAILGYQEALKISEASNDSAMMAQQVGNIAGIYLSTEQYDLSKKFSKITLEIAENIGNQYVKSAALTNLSVLYTELNLLDSARMYAEQALELKQQLNNTAGLAIALQNIGRIDFIEGDLKTAEDHFKEALELFEAQNTVEGIVAAKGGLGAVYVASNRKERGIELLNESKKLSEKNKLGNTLKAVLFEASNGFAMIDDYRNAYRYLKETKELTDSLFANNNRQAVSELIAIYDSEKQKNEILNLKKKQEIHQLELERQNALIERERAIKFGLIGGALLLALLGALALRSYQRKKKDNELIRSQKEMVEEQKAIVEEKNKEILDSIAYAKRIQNAILPTQKIVKEYLNNSFILYLPKDIIAGDFYWMEGNVELASGEKTDKGVLFAACDCTGHGVPGAMVSVICNNGLNRSVREFGLRDPGKILDQCRDIVIEEFDQSDEDVKDGMDIALCSLQGNVLKYAGANNPLWIIRKRSKMVEEIKANKQPIGKFDELIPYQTHELTLEEGDSVYIFSDGYADQFGGTTGKKMKTANFKKLLLSLQEHSMEKQGTLLQEAFVEWRGELDQLDDVCVIGVRV